MNQNIIIETFLNFVAFFVCIAPLAVLGPIFDALFKDPPLVYYACDDDDLKVSNSIKY